MNSAEQKALRRKVHDSLKPFYDSKGFTINKTNGVFIKNGFEISWGVKAKNVDSIYFNPSFRIYNQKIKRVLELIFGPETDDITLSRLAGCTLAQEFGVHEYDYLGDNEQNIDHGTTYRVDETTDLDKLVADHVNYMEKVGLPFFEKVSTLEGIHDFINGKIMQAADDQFEDIKRVYGKRDVLSGVTVSYLLNKLDTESLIQKYIHLFEGSTYIFDDVQKIKEYFQKSLA
jgi:hypothetical protein